MRCTVSTNGVHSRCRPHPSRGSPALFVRPNMFRPTVPFTWTIVIYRIDRPNIAQPSPGCCMVLQTGRISPSSQLDICTFYMFTSHGGKDITSHGGDTIARSFVHHTRKVRACVAYFLTTIHIIWVLSMLPCQHTSQGGQDVAG